MENFTNRRTRLSEEIKRGVKYLSTGLILVLVLSGTLFLFTVSTASQNGYKFRQEEIINKELEAENHQLQLDVLKATSFSELLNKNQIKKMIPAETTEYYESKLERLSRKN